MTARIAPVPDVHSEPFWSGGADGQLRIQRCTQCGHFLHPPGWRCPTCGGRDLAFAPVTGVGEVYSYAVNHQEWHPAFPVPYVIAAIELPEQCGLRVVSNVVGCDPSDVHIGLPVRVVFEPVGEWYLPLFTPEGR